MNKTTGFAVMVLMGLTVLVGSLLSENSEPSVSHYSLRNLALDEVTALTITGKHSVELERRDGIWLLKDGRRADVNIVQRALNAMRDIDTSTVVAEHKEKFAELKVDDAQGTQVQGYVGKELVADFVIGTAGAGGSHIRTGSTVFSMKGVFPGIFSRPLAAWIDRRIMTTKLEEVAKIEIAIKGEKPIVLVSSDAENLLWSLSDPSVLPSKFRFDHLTARSVVRTAIGVRAREFVESKNEEQDFFEDADRVVIYFKKADQEPQTLLLGKSVSEKLVYAKLLPQGETFILSAHSAQLLRRKLLDYRDLQMMKFKESEVVKVKVTQGELSFVLTRGVDGWKLVASPPLPPGTATSEAKVRALFQEVLEQRAAGIVEDVKQRLGKVSKSIVLTFQDGSEAALEFGDRFKLGNEDAIYVRGNWDDSLYYMPAGSVASVNSDLGGVVARKNDGEPPFANIDSNALQNLPPEIREQLLLQIQGERRKQEMQKAFEEQSTVRETK